MGLYRPSLFGVDLLASMPVEPWWLWLLLLLGSQLGPNRSAARQVDGENRTCRTVPMLCITCRSFRC